MTTALVLGSFDLLHYGHLMFLNNAAKLGDLIVGLGTDEYQAGYKRQPIMSYEERKAALEQLAPVAEVAPRSEVSIASLIEGYRPDYLVCGSDWIGHPFLELSGIDAAYLEEWNVALVFIPRGHGMSTSLILDRVEQSRA